MSCRMNEPMSWKEFKKLPTDVQALNDEVEETTEEYIGPVEPEIPDEKPMPEKRTIPLRVLSGKLNFSGNAGAIFTKANLLFDSAKEYDIKIIFKEVCDA